MSEKQETEILKLSADLGKMLQNLGISMCTAESCTGGLISAFITDISGSSEWFDRAFVTYTNEAKMEMLGVSSDTLERYGAVSMQTVEEMVRGAVERSSASVGVAVSGIAGPTGGTPDKPVGTVWMAWRYPDGYVETECHHFDGNRQEVRLHTVAEAFRRMLEKISGHAEKTDKGHF